MRNLDVCRSVRPIEKDRCQLTVSQASTMEQRESSAASEACLCETGRVAEGISAEMIDEQRVHGMAHTIPSVNERACR